MARKIFSGSSQYLGSSTTRNLHTGSGKVIAVLFSCNLAAGSSLVLYDNTSATAPLILQFHASLGNHVFKIYPANACPVFSTGLTVVTGANCWAHIITEALI